jgi:purine-cytosine permease-like protein
MQMSLPVLIISVALFFILFFGIGFLLNMLFRSSWVMVIIFPLIAIFIVNESKAINYVRNPMESLTGLFSEFAQLHVADMVILASGLTGAVLAGITIKFLRKSGYQMF